jgi:hypothetical protein
MSQNFVYLKCVAGKVVPRYNSGVNIFIGCKFDKSIKNWVWDIEKITRIPIEEWIRSKKSYDRAVKNGDVIICSKKEYDEYENNQKKDMNIKKQKQPDKKTTGSRKMEEQK